MGRLCDFRELGTRNALLLPSALMSVPLPACLPVPGRYDVVWASKSAVANMTHLGPSLRGAFSCFLLPSDLIGVWGCASRIVKANVNQTAI